MISQKTLKQIARFAIKQDWQQAFGGRSKGNRHLLRMLKIATFLARKMNAKLDIVQAGALLHDIALSKGSDESPDRSEHVANEILRKFDLTQAEVEQIIECITAHEGKLERSLLETKIVHDADVIEKSGPLGVIRHTWKLVNLGVISEAITDRDAWQILTHLKWRQKEVQSPIAKAFVIRMNRDLNQEIVQQIATKTASFAKQGLVTDQIARIIAKDLPSEQQTKLLAQLDLRYLKDFNPP